MDERTISAAEAATERHLTQALLSLGGARTYSIVVLGRNGDEPFPITASGATDRAEKMSEAGINLRRDQWAAGYIDSRRTLQICGNNETAKTTVIDHLQHKR